MNILFCGDIMPGGVLPYQDEYYATNVKDMMQWADFRVGTLECALGDNISFDEQKMKSGKNIVYARESDLFRVKELGINLVSLANNHFYDLGEEGLLNTIRLLKENDILFCGAGINLKEASKPCIVEIKKKKFAFIGCCFKDIPPRVVHAATENMSGIYQTDRKGICEVIRNAKQEADYVIVLPHWGIEYCYVPPRECKELAKQMIVAGADAVVGSHTHIMNPFDEYKGKPIYYSMGNFLFPDFCLQVPRPICYPETREEVYNMPVVYNYPKKTQKPVRVVWKRSSRIGVVPILTFLGMGTIKHRCYFTILTNNNILRLLRGWDEQKENLRMFFYGSSVGEMIYSLSYRAKKSCYNIFKRLRK